MSDWLPTIILIVIVFFLVRWFAGPSDGSAANPSQGIPGITPAAVENLHSAFPDIPIPNLIYSLSKTRSVQRTSEEIIEKGYLAAPPATYSPPTALLPPSVNPPSAPSSPTRPTTSSSSKTTATKPISLIDRYSLSDRLSALSGSGPGAGVGASTPNSVDSSSDSDMNASLPGLNVKGQGTDKQVWADSKEARERGLRERKEKMILEARR